MVDAKKYKEKDIFKSMVTEGKRSSRPTPKFTTWRR